MPDPIRYTEHPQDVVAHAVALLEAGTPFALITSVEIKGGAARELGSLAVVEADGAMTGYMSNGCIDADIRMQALSLLEGGGGARVLRYGEGSPFLDLTLPCGGALELLLDPAPAEAVLRHVHAELSARRAVAMPFALPDGATRSFTYAPKPRLALAGRGAVFRATAEVAAAAGFELHLYSPEEGDLQALEPLSAPLQTRLTTPSAAPALDLDAFSGFLTLFHDHDWEPALLQAALATQARFIGCLGSRRTHEMRLALLQAEGVPAEALTRITGPVGLVPSLRQAPLIAVSAVAQLASVFPTTVQ
jgi:xanthine dehydrogenase accessory factor